MDGISAVASITGLISFAQNLVSVARDARDWHAALPDLDRDIKDLEEVIQLYKQLSMGSVDKSHNPLSEETNAICQKLEKQIIKCDEELNRIKADVNKLKPPDIGSENNGYGEAKGIGNHGFRSSLANRFRHILKRADLDHPVKRMRYALDKDQLRSIIESVRRQKTLLYDWFYLLRDHQNHVEKWKRLLVWLYPSSTSAKHDKIKQKRAANSGSWFFKAAEFERWIHDHHKHLFLCTGKPGAGKSSAAVDHLEEKYGQTKSVAVLYFYWDYELQEIQTMTSFMAALVKEVASVRRTRFPRLETFFDEREHRRPEPEYQDLTELKEIFFELIDDTFKAKPDNLYPKAFLLLDALDECDQIMLVEITEFIKTCVSRTSTDSERASAIKVLVTSRPNPSPVQDLMTLDDTLHFEINAQQEDIKNFLEREIDRRDPSGRDIDPDVRNEITEKVGIGVDGMFLLVRLRLDYVLSWKTNPREMKKALSTLPPDLDAAYDKVMERISRKKNDQEALVVLSWVYRAWRPLHMDELREAKSIERGQKTLDKSEVPKGHLLIDLCEGLILRATDGRVQFSHFTVREYLKSHYNNHLLLHADIAWSCITCLGFGVFGKPCTDNDSLADRFSQVQFGAYAAKYWAAHTRFSSAASNIEIQNYVVGVLRPKGRRACIEQMNEYARKDSLLHNAAANGLAAVCKHLLERNNGQNISYQGYLDAKEIYHGETALHLAAKYGYAEVVGLLLKAGADVEARGVISGNTAIMYAAEAGHKKVVGLLLGAGARTDILNVLGETALDLATKNRHPKVVRTLLAAGTSVEANKTIKAKNRGTILNVFDSAVLDKDAVPKSSLASSSITRVPTSDTFSQMEETALP